MLFPTAQISQSPLPRHREENRLAEHHSDVEVYRFSHRRRIRPAGLADAVYGRIRGIRRHDWASPGARQASSSRIENSLGFSRGPRGATSLRGRQSAQAIVRSRNLAARGRQRRTRSRPHHRNWPTARKVSCHPRAASRHGRAVASISSPEKSVSARGVYYGGWPVTEAMACKGEIVSVVERAIPPARPHQFAVLPEKSGNDISAAGGIPRRHSVPISDRSDQKDHPISKVWPQNSISEVHGEQHLEEIFRHVSTPRNHDRVQAKKSFHLYRRVQSTDWLGAWCNATPGALSSTDPILRDGKRTQGWSIDRDPSLRNQRPGIFVVG